MSCGRGVSAFRLLDAYTGWDPAKVERIAGLEDPAGIYLDFPAAPGIDPSAVAQYIPPRWLASGCEPCTWFLLTPPPLDARVLRMGPCTEGFRFARQMEGAGVAIASAGPWLAVAQRDDVWVFAIESMEPVGRIMLRNVRGVAFGPDLELIVAVEKANGTAFGRYSATGEFLGNVAATVPGSLDRMAASRDCRLWAITAQDGVLSAWVLERGADAFAPAALDDIRAAFRATNLAAAGTLGFELRMQDPEGEPVDCVYSFFGRCTDPGSIGLPPPPQRYKQGQLLTVALDSGVDRCRWHRIRIDADIPRGCGVELSVATSDEESPTPQGNASADPRWSGFAAGVPHPDDWQAGQPGTLDFLVQQPPGEYVFVRIRLTGDGVATPRVRRVRLDFERNTSLEFLPAVYRENPDAENFTERFLAIFDAQMEELDDAIQSAPALLRGDSIPDELLPWVASFLDAGFDQDQGPAQRREILKALPALYRQRGTLSGMQEVLRLVFGAEAVIEELGANRAWGTVGRTAVVGQTRLFGRGRARFRLGESALCAAPVNNFGDPRTDPFQAQAYRFTVAMPARGSYGPISRQKLAALIEAQKPAHTVASTVRTGGDGFFIGRNLALGADTLLAPLPPSVLGKNGTAQLNRRTILYSKQPGHGLHLRAGVNTKLDCDLALR